MPSRRNPGDKLQDAADALREAAESFSDDRDGDNPRERPDDDPDRRYCYGSSRVLRRLSNALLEAVDALREVASTRCCDPECVDDQACYDSCQAGSQPPMPPYPPYPPYAPHAPFPPYPPYPPVVIIGGSSGCACQQTMPLAGQMASSQSVPPTPTPVPVPQSQGAQPTGAVRPATSASPAGFPDTVHTQVETLLDIGESAAAMVKRALSQRQMGAES